jgi:hypothetical protein
MTPPSPLKRYWAIRLARCKRALEKNRFDVLVADDVQSAGALFLETVLPALDVSVAAWGDSMTLQASGVLSVMQAHPTIRMIDPFDARVSLQERWDRRRQALMADLFLTGSNAVTETGMLVNLDMVGNRVAGITFGPKAVVLFIGRNKLTATLEGAMRRIKQVAAPANAIRHPDLKTPCIQTAECTDCSSPDRICNTWCITEKSFPNGRIKIILINQDLGL